MYEVEEHHFDAQGFCSDMSKAPRDRVILAYKDFCFSNGKVLRRTALCRFNNMAEEELNNYLKIAIENKNPIIPERWAGFYDEGFNLDLKVPFADFKPDHWTYLKFPKDFWLPGDYIYINSLDQELNGHHAISEILPEGVIIPSIYKKPIPKSDLLGKYINVTARRRSFIGTQEM